MTRSTHPVPAKASAARLTRPPMLCATSTTRFADSDSQPLRKLLSKHIHTQTPVVVVEGTVEARSLQMQFQRR